MRNPFIYVIHSTFIHIHGAYMLFVIKNVIFKLITCKQSMLFDQFGGFLIIIFILDNVFICDTIDVMGSFLLQCKLP